MTNFGENVPQLMLSLTSLYMIWKYWCNHIRARLPSRDTCDICFKKKVRVEEIIYQENEDNAEDDVENENIVLQSALHIKQERAQRFYLQENIRVAKENK